LCGQLLQKNRILRRQFSSTVGVQFQLNRLVGELREQWFNLKKLLEGVILNNGLT
jgi:hypothetical protein